jgi:hypothetical protein
MSVREKFVARFSESEALAIEAAADEHGNGINDQRRGSDPFKWALLIAIGYECASRESFREHHKITAPWDDLRQWMRDEADLASHDGDCDYLSLLCGAYDDFVKKAEGQ